MTYPSESDILLMKKKEQVLRPEKPAGLPLWLLLLFLLPVGGVVLAWALAPIRAARPIPYAPATLITPTATWQPTPTLKPTSAELTVWNLFPTETPAVSAVETAVSPTTSPATAAPTHTPFSTWTPAATATPWPTHTPFPTWTPAATWTPQATAVAVDEAATRQAALVATWQAAPPADNEPSPLLYVGGLLASLTLVILSVAAVFWARNHRPVPVQLLGPSSLVSAANVPVSAEPLPSSGGGAWRLPPPVGAPVLEGTAPVRTGARTGVTGAAPVQELSAPVGGAAPAPVGEPESITIRLLPEDPEVDEAVARAICEVWNGMERPSFTRVCNEYFNGKNSDRLAIVRRAIEWGRANALIEDNR